MNTNKSIFLSIIFLIIIPCKVIFAQDVESDTTVQTELDIKYDSVLERASASLTTSAYQQAIDYYKAASALKPSETYPYKMISYVEDLAAKQKRADELKQKLQIKNNLIKANQAIVDKNWNTAKILFNEILSLHPDKTDEDYAKSKVQAIDLELQRIVLRTPVKEEPKPVIVPKNRREARAMRKVEERNAEMAAKTNATAPPPAPIASSVKNVTPVADATKKTVQKPIQKLPPAGNAVISQPVAKEIQKPAQAQVSATPANESVSLPAVKETQQKHAEVTRLATNLPVASSANKELTQKPIQALPPEKKPAVPPVTNNTAAQTQTSLPRKSVTVAPPPATKVSTPATNQEIIQKPKETTAAVRSEPVPATPVAEVLRPTDVSQLKLSDSSDYIKFTCQDISFIGSNAYIKVLIQNSSLSSQFQTDTLHVSVIKNNGSIKKLNQRFVSNFPIVMPLKELVLVSFSDASFGLEPDDVFIIEMKDKSRKTKLAVQVPWNLYTQSKNL